MSDRRLFALGALAFLVAAPTEANAGGCWRPNGWCRRAQRRREEEQRREEKRRKNSE